MQCTFYPGSIQPHTLLHRGVVYSNSYSNNPVSLLGNEVTTNTKRKQASSDTPEPRQVALVVLPGHPHVHAPHSRDNVHGQDDCTDNGELAKDVGILFGALIHADVDLGDVVAMCSAEQAGRREC